MHSMVMIVRSDDLMKMTKFLPCNEPKKKRFYSMNYIEILTCNVQKNVVKKLFNSL